MSIFDVITDAIAEAVALPFTLASKVDELIGKAIDE